MVIVLGSGGHTAEMMSLLRDLDPTRYIHRTYIISSGDSFSEKKALEMERLIQAKHKSSSISPTGKGDLNIFTEKEVTDSVTKKGDTDPVTGTWDVKVVTRAREIHQPLSTAPFSSLSCLIDCFRTLYETSRMSKAAPLEYPDVIITNGPASAVMVIIAATALKFMGVAPVWKMKVIYVESWARVKTLSLSGKVLLRTGMCDKFIVQWDALAKAINDNGTRKKVDWVGFLVD
jgi:beta-1,4-N-acetylglucosaminyltransferase